MYAVIKHGGRQYQAEVGDILLLDRMSGEPKSFVELRDVLALVDPENKETLIGQPFVEKAWVKGELINHGRARKVIIFKKRRRKDSKTKRGFRRDFSRVKILEIIKGE